MDVVGQVRCWVSGEVSVPTQWRGWAGLDHVVPAAAGERFAWLMATDRPAADVMVRSLISVAQAGCPVASLVLVSMLSAGLRRLGRSVMSPDPVGEVVGEFIEVIYTLAVERYHQSLAAALLLTTRRRLGRRRDRQERWDKWMTDSPVDETSGSTWVGEELIELLATIGVPRGDAALIVETRVFDVPVEDVARRRGMRPTTVYKARRRAERTVQQQVAAAAAA